MDMDERMKNLVISISDDGEVAGGGDSFGQRAENYYQKRPQLIALLKDLYNGYTTLLNRSESMKRKPSSVILNISQDEVDYSEITSLQFDSDLESSFSYHHQQIENPIQIPSQIAISDIDSVVAELVGKTVENDVLSDQVRSLETISDESGRKIDLLRKLVDVLESERVILLNENTKLGYRVNTLLEENRGLACEAIFMKRKAAELARCGLMMREDHRVCMLSRKIEDLQGQIYGLEKRNKEYYHMLMMSSSKEVNNNAGCFQLEKFKFSYSKKKDDVSNGGKKKWWWGKVVKMDMFMCGFSST